MFAVRKLLLSEPQALLLLSAELLLQLVCRRLSALRLTDLAFRTLQRVARPAFWEWHCLCAGRKRQVPFGFCPHRKRQPFSLTFKTLAYVTHEDICKCFTGDTLLAIRAPSGTRLEVPIPEGPNGQKKYQIHLKSTSGPIDVLLVNKDAWSSPPVVLPVPPPEDLIQCQAVAPSKPQIPPLAHFQEASVPSSTQPSTPTPSSTQDHSPPAQKAPSTECTVSVAESKSSGDLDPLSNVPASAGQTAGLDTQPLQSSASLDSSSVLPSPSTSFEPIKPDPTGMLELPKELSEMFDPTRECMNSELLEELMSSEVFAPLLRLSPPPGDHDYIYNLDESEGVCDLFDVPVLNL
uniref:E2F transcription factor 4 n=1 Tax=Anser cygnoides TaxID=8845 RepID=A0A8B9E5E0_ANSCY